MTTAATPADRLALSRERLRLALNGAPAEPASAPHATPAGASWWDDLRALPGTTIVIEAAHRWWARHPLRVTALVAIGAAQAIVRPLARRHPLGLVLGAALVGARFAWSRPWRWALEPAHWAGLLPQLLLTSLAAQARGQQPDRA